MSTDQPKESGSRPYAHVPVMLAEVVAWFADVPEGTIVDTTVGGAGHTAALLAAHPHLRVLGLDRDPVAVAVATERLARFGDRASVRYARYDAIETVIDDLLGPEALVSGVLFDLGVSSVHLDEGHRGFSYRIDAPLDMRMDPTMPTTAADIVNRSTEGELARILRIYGDERFAARIARAIIASRPVLRTVALASIVTTAIPAATRRHGGHPAKRTFQALRIAVNDELSVLATALDGALERLAPEGRCVVLAYHSGEDRIVKERFLHAETGGCTCPVGLPCVCRALPRGRRVIKGVTRPSSAEVDANPRAASAIARVFEAAR